MLALVGPGAPARARAVFLEELNARNGFEEPIDFFHVAIDLPGFGSTGKEHLLHSKRKDRDAPIASADFLADVISALGKHYGRGGLPSERHHLVGAP